MTPIDFMTFKMTFKFERGIHPSHFHHHMVKQNRLNDMARVERSSTDIR